MPPHRFNYGILDERDHRPWPMPSQPLVMTQTWHDLLFAHWRLPASQLAPYMPTGVQLDLFAGEAWLGIVPFHMSNVAPRGVPSLPWLSAFPELNVRTYVRVGEKAGVYFFSLDASNAIAVAVARAIFQLPYYWATMSVAVGSDGVRYESRRSARDTRGRLSGRYAPEGETFNARPGTLEYFLTERYCLYTTLGRTVLIVEIHHPPWPLQIGRATFDENTIAEAAGIHLVGPPEHLHFAKRQDIVAWSPRVASASAPHKGVPYTSHSA